MPPPPPKKVPGGGWVALGPENLNFLVFIEFRYVFVVILI